MASALGLPERGGQSPLQALEEALRARSQLLVLDNFEQVVPAAPCLVELLGACPGLRLLVTSRELLRVSGEHEFALAPLSLPPPDADCNADDPGDSEAVRLFV